MLVIVVKTVYSINIDFSTLRRVKKTHSDLERWTDNYDHVDILDIFAIKLILDA